MGAVGDRAGGPQQVAGGVGEDIGVEPVLAAHQHPVERDLLGAGPPEHHRGDATTQALGQRQGASHQDQALHEAGGRAAAAAAQRLQPGAVALAGEERHHDDTSAVRQEGWWPRSSASSVSWVS